MSIAKGFSRRFLRYNVPALLLALVFLGLGAGCSGPLKLTYTSGDRKLSVDNSPSIFITALKDGRSVEEKKNPREIGRIEATVFDINTDRLVIANDPAEFATGALSTEFAKAGYKISIDAARADYLLEGELKEFRLDITDRDRVAVEISASVRSAATGNVVWSGAAAERSDRYAGVVGNSKASIEMYLNASLAKAATSIVDGATAGITGTRHTFAPAATTVRQAPKTTPNAAAGAMDIKSAPARARVYIGDIYYGLSPLTLKLAPGVYELKIKQKGYKDGAEKISVREGETTEVEMELEGE